MIKALLPITAPVPITVSPPRMDAPEYTVTLSSRVGCLFAPRRLWPPRGKSAQGHALIKLYFIPDAGGLAYHYAGAVVDKEVLSDGSSRMDVDARQAVGVFCHHPGDQRHLKQVQLMGHPVCENRVEPRIGENHLVRVKGRGIPLIAGLHVGGQNLPHLRQSGKKLQHNRVRPLLCLLRLLGIRSVS